MDLTCSPCSWKLLCNIYARETPLIICFSVIKMNKTCGVTSGWRGPPNPNEHCIFPKGEEQLRLRQNRGEIKGMRSLQIFVPTLLFSSFIHLERCVVVVVVVENVVAVVHSADESFFRRFAA